MKDLKLTPRETEQLYIVLRMFSRGMDMGKEMFDMDGPARKLAERIADHILTMDGITISK